VRGRSAAVTPVPDACPIDAPRCAQS
jgi:hypothetical protein